MDPTRILPTCLAASILLGSSAAVAEPRYLPQIREELTKMGLRATCTAESATKGRCQYTLDSTRTGVRFDVRLDYSDDSDTIYHYVNRYLALPSSNPRVSEVLRRLMQLNWSMLIGKFEWEPRQGEIRLSAIENTDSNFDRRAFRSTVQALHNLAERYYRDLDGLVRGAPAVPVSPPATAGPAKKAAPSKKAP